MTYLLTEPFDTALRTVRRALANSDLNVVEVLDLSRTIEGMLGVNMHGCTVLCVLPAAARHAYAAIAGLFPLHVVIAPRGRHTEIHILESLQRDETLPPDVMAPVIATQARLVQALDRIAMRESECAVV
jgi:hypothetical protein